MKLQKTICILLLTLAVFGMVYSLSAQRSIAEAVPVQHELPI